MAVVEEIKQELKECINPEKAEFLPKFFQAFPGGYGEGDSFLQEEHGDRSDYRPRVSSFRE